MASPPPPPLPPVLPEELFEEIFLRLDDAADLARAYAACSTFGRVVSARRFLRRFRSLHSPPVLGLLIGSGRQGSHLPVDRFLPAEPPHRSAPAARALARAADFTFSFLPVQPSHRSGPAARALARAADFTFSFLPDPSLWMRRDSRDGRVLLSRRIANATAFDDLVICDPLHRRYVRIPPIPDDLTDSIRRLGTIGFARSVAYFEPFLAPAGEDEDDKLKEEEPSLCH